MQNARQLTEISRITTFNLKNDTALLLGTLIYLLGYTDYGLDYKRPKLHTLATHNQMQNSSSGSFTMLAMNH